MMPNNWFRFKKFMVRQEGAAMKVGTDGVLLGAWARIRPADRRYLDVGAGTGVIALMLAQRTDIGPCDNRPQIDAVEIDAVEMDAGSCGQARENFAASEWGSRINLFGMPVQDFAAATAARYDHIVSNPPYFVDSLPSPDDARTAARHTSHLSYGELLSSVSRLLSDDGIFTAIIPSGGEADLVRVADAEGMRVSRRCVVLPLPGLSPKRFLLEFSRGRPTSSVPAEETSLVINTGVPNEFTPEYRELTRDFYLKF